VEAPGGDTRWRLSIDRDLQRFVMDLLNRSMTQHSAAVVIRPDNGQVLAMASYENNGNGAKGENLCLRADFLQRVSSRSLRQRRLSKIAA